MAMRLTLGWQEKECVERKQSVPSMKTLDSDLGLLLLMRQAMCESIISSFFLYIIHILIRSDKFLPTCLLEECIPI